MPHDDPLDRLIEDAAAMLALAVEPEWKPAIRAHLAVTLRLARLVDEFPLSDEAEPGPVFRA
jgi:1-carboxybiuret hydrolase subunit AtzG-like